MFSLEPNQCEGFHQANFLSVWGFGKSNKQKKRGRPNLKAIDPSSTEVGYIFVCFSPVVMIVYDCHCLCYVMHSQGHNEKKHATRKR